VKKFIPILIFVSVFYFEGFSQNSNSTSTFISVYIGDLSILSENFNSYYGSKNDLTFGLGFGIPLSNSLTFDASISYFQKKSNFSQMFNEEISNEFDLTQFIYNAGLQVHLLPNRIIGLSFLFGLNYATVNEERIINNVIEYEFDGSGNLGVYGGANFEINFGRSPLALHGDIKYTYSWDSLLEYEEDYRELKYTGGIKVYLANRWR
jgi:hypothetical protein